MPPAPTKVEIKRAVLRQPFPHLVKEDLFRDLDAVQGSPFADVV